MSRSPTASARARASLAFAPLVFGGALAALQETWPQTPATPTILRDEGYVGSDACKDCHVDNHASWSASHHSRMTQEGKASAVLAPLPATTPVIEGFAWRVEREGELVFATPLTAQGAVAGARQRIALVTGSHHYQIYWLEAQGQNELGQLPFVWHLAEGRWVPRKSLFLSPPPPSVYLEAGRWPRTCMKCHTTNGTLAHPSDERTHVAEFGIACEACHGPGDRHVTSEPERAAHPDSASSANSEAPRDIVNPSKLDHVRTSQVCGQCHGIHPLDSAAVAQWQSAGFAFRPGEDLAATRDLLRGRADENGERMRAFLERHPGTLDELFWRDGQVRVSGREYNGLVESPCYQRGELDCLSCHEMHPGDDDRRPLAEWADDQLRRGADGPQACLQCHAQFSDGEKLRAHTHHAAGSTGSDCLNCHMPYTTYGLTKSIRSHTIASPSAAVELATGRPNACNLCHLDRPLAWTAEHLNDWYGAARPELDRDHERVAASVLWALTGDAGVRALAAWSFGWDAARAASGVGWSAYLLSTLLQDPYDAVRFVAQRSVRLDPRFSDFALEFHTSLAEQRLHVQESVVPRWRADGLTAPKERAAALLIDANGSLDEAKFRELFARQDQRSVRLSE